MIQFVSRLMVAVLLVALSMPVNAASRYTLATEVVAEGQSPRSEVAIVTLAGDKGRIDFVERNGRKEEGGLYLMTLDGGKTAVLGDKGKSMCAEEQKKLQQQQAAATQQAANDQQAQEQALIRAVGEDNYRGLLALVDCQHQRAEALATAGGASSNPDHKLSSLWLKALIANDLKQKDRTAVLYPQLVSADADIDTEQQASLETDKVLMDVRQERRARGISCQ